MSVDEARLVVWLDDEHVDLKDVRVFVDGEEVGLAPWEGTVSPGVHEVRVESSKFFSFAEKTKIWPKKTRTMQVKLYPRDLFNIGRFYIGTSWGASAGVAFNDGKRRPAKSLGAGPSLMLGVKLPSESSWWDVGIVFGPQVVYRALSRSFISDVPWDIEEEGPVSSYGDKMAYGTAVPITAQLRGVIPMFAPFVFWSADIQLGVATDFESAGFVGILRGGVAFCLGSWVELRFDIAGIRVMQVSFEGSYYVDQPDSDDSIFDNERPVSSKIFTLQYSPSFAFVIRI